MEPIIEVKNVHKSFKAVRAVDGIDLRIYQGQFVALLGPNGAGKTTIVEMIEGIQTPDRGTIEIMGMQWKGNAEKLHRIIGLSLQETHFIDKLTVDETLSLFASFYDLDRQRISEIIAIIDLEEKRKAYVANLSGGQRQRLALGMAMLNRPGILLLDEPTTGLDPNARRDIWAILRSLKHEANTSLILTTHYMEEAEQLCDHIVIIDKGKILKKGSLAQLLNDDHHQKVIEFTLEGDRTPSHLLTPNAPFSIQWNAETGRGMVMLTQIETELPAFIHFLGQHNVRLSDLECRRKTLDDLFTSMTGRRLYE